MENKSPTTPVAGPMTNVQPISIHRISDNMLLLLVAGGVVMLHILTNGQYGFHRDELDILMNARQLDWGYVAYPPITPFIARIGLTLFGSSLVGLRLFPAVAQGIVVVLAGLMARDFGGGRLAQVTAALAVAISPMALTAGTLIQYLSFDYLWWVLLAFCTTRLLRTDKPQWWLGIGTAVGLGMMTKYTMLFFVAGLVAAVLLTVTRRYLRSPWLWAGVAAALLIFLPNLLWQIQHDFISLDFLQAIHARDIEWGRAENFLRDQFLTSTNPFALPIWLAGFLFFVTPAGKRFRPLLWMFVVTFLLLLAARGRAYYMGPAYPILLAAGATWWEGWLHRLAQRRAQWAKVGLALLLMIGGVVAILLIKPVAPINSPLWDVAAAVNETSSEMVGWPDLIEEVAKIYRQLAAEQQATAAILAGNYGEAGAFDLYRRQYDLPPVFSGANSLWARGFGNPPPETVIVVGFEGQYARRYFASCEPAGKVSNRYGVKNEESTRHTTIYLCQRPWHPWAEMWPTMQWFQ